MTFKEIYEEAALRGFSDLLDAGVQQARLKRWVNQAYKEISDFAPWPFLEATKEGNSPLAIADLGHVLGVVDKTNDGIIPPLDRRSIVEMDPTLNEPGAPQYWYPNGETTVATWPTNVTSLMVRYVSVPVDLVADADVPVLPVKHHDLIVDGTVVRLYKNRDAYEAMAELRKEWERGLRQMVHSLLKPNYDQDHIIERTGAPGSYLG